MTDIRQLFKNPRLQSELSAYARQDSVLQKAAILIKAFFDGMNDEYQQYERKNLPFKRARVTLEFITDEENDRLGFLPTRNVIYLAFIFVLHNTYAITESNMSDLINRFTLWGGEEANHSVYSQFKKSKPTLLNSPFETEVEHVVSDHEFRALQANIRQAKREKMPQKTIDGMQELLERLGFVGKFSKDEKSSRFVHMI